MLKKCLALFLVACATHLEAQVAPLSEIKFGMSGSFVGHFQYYGNAIKNAIMARFERINAQGGIQGKKLSLVAMNDSGEPKQTLDNVQAMMSQGITMFIGVMGTRGVLSLLPLIKDKKIALFFPWAGDQQLQNKELTNIINGPGLVHSQIVGLVDHITHILHLKKIAIFYAEDDFSSAIKDDLVQELKKLNLQPIATAGYNRFTMDIARPTKKLIKEDPRVVISIGTHIPTEKMINQFFENGLFGTQFFGIDSTFLVKDILSSKGVKFSHTSLVPDPTTSQIELATQYRQDMATYFPQEDLSALSFEYYAATALLTTVMQNLREPLTQDAIIKQLETLKNTSILGFPVDFDPATRSVFSRKIWII
jgi:ABC-type branched-subunit amino acid transport system substrate-binding protein